MIDRPEMIAQLMTFDEKGDGEEIINENVSIEVTNGTKDGYIEIAFNDRNERCYLQLRLSELIEHVMAKGVAD